MGGKFSIFNFQFSILLLLFPPVLAFSQPSEVLPRGTRAYLVNYGAIGGDRFLADFSARRFVLVDEGQAADIRRMLKINPALPILQYKDLVALYPTMKEYGDVNRDEFAFLHSCEPSGLSVAMRGDTASLSWMPDIRDLRPRGYRVFGLLDSTGRWNALVDSTIGGTRCTVRIPKSVVFVAVASVTAGDSLFQYGLPVRLPGDTRSRPVVAVRGIVTDRTPTLVHAVVTIDDIGDVAPDSLAVVCDINKNNVLDAKLERFIPVRTGKSWTLDFSIPITTDDHGGFEFFVTAYAKGTAWRSPASGAYTTNINNRVTNNSYGFFVMDVGSSVWRRAYIDQALGYFAKYGYTGLFEDDTWYKVSSWSTDVMIPFNYNDVDWKNNAFTMLDSIKLAIAPRPAIFNGLFAGASDSLLAHADGGMTEGFAYTHWSGYVTDAYWKELCDVGLRAQHRFRKIWEALGGAPHDDPAARMYVLGSYLLVADSLGQYANATSYQEFSHFPEMDIPLGAALQTADSTVDELCHLDPGGTPYYRRDFARGTVVVNATANRGVVHAAGAGMPMLRVSPATTIAGGYLETIAGTDTIPPHQARVYLRAGQAGGALFTPAIDSIVVTPDPAPADGATPMRLRCRVTDRSGAAFHADTTRPLYVTADLGALGGPKEQQLLNDGAPPLRGPSWYEASFTIPAGAPRADTVIRFTAWSTTGMIAVRGARARITSADSTNLVMNYSYEIDNDDNGIPDLWIPYGLGFDYDTTGVNAESGRRSVHVASDTLNASHGVYARITVNQATPADLLVSGWSKAAGVTGVKNGDYALYVDVRYQDGTPLYGQTAQFTTGTHDWEYAEKIIHPTKPVQSLSLYALFRNNHSGEAWFDNIAVRPYAGPAAVERAEYADSLNLLDITPNPVRGAMEVWPAANSDAGVDLIVTDMLGRIALREWHPITRVGQPLFTDVSPLLNGMYLLMLRDGQRYWVGRFVKTR